MRKISTLKDLFHCLNKKLSSCLSIPLINENLSKKGDFFIQLMITLEQSNRKPFIFENGLYFKKEFLKNNKIYQKISIISLLINMNLWISTTKRL